MPSTSVHLPHDLVSTLDALAARRRVSRNRLILEACERLVQQDAGEWPQGFFANDDLSAADLRELRAAGRALEVATSNPRHFSRLAGLHVLDWSRMPRPGKRSSDQ